MIRIVLRGVMAVILLATHAAAQANSLPLSLEDCIRLAQSAQSVIGVARQQSEIARYGLTQARAGFFPQARLNNAFTYNSPLLYNPNLFSFVALNGIREYVSVLNTALEVDTSGRLRASLARAHADQDAAAANLGITQRDLRRLVTIAFYQLQLSRRLVQAAQDTRAEAQSFEARTRLLVKNGEAAQADLIKASAQVAFLEQALNAAELQALVDNHTLASFWTRDVTTPLTLQDVLGQPVPPSLESKPEESASDPFLRRLEFDLLEAQRRGFLADSRRARADLLPQANIIFQYGLDSTLLAIRDRGYAGFFNFNIPVFDWFKARSASRQFQLQAKQVEFSRQIAERTFSKEYWDVVERVNKIYEQISITQVQVKLSEENLRISRLRYEGGEGAALEVVAAQTQLAQARSNYYTALASYWIAKAELQVASGR